MKSEHTHVYYLYIYLYYMQLVVVSIRAKFEHVKLKVLDKSDTNPPTELFLLTAAKICCQTFNYCVALSATFPINFPFHGFVFVQQWKVHVNRRSTYAFSAKWFPLSFCYFCCYDNQRFFCQKLCVSRKKRKRFTFASSLI